MRDGVTRSEREYWTTGKGVDVRVAELIFAEPR
jgi:hypothetical protein